MIVLIVVLAVAGFVMFFCGLWFAITLMLGGLSGWYGLADRYPDQPEEPMVELKGQSGFMGPGVRLNGVLTLWVQHTFGWNLAGSGWLYSLSGLILVYTYFQIPLMVIVFVPALEGLRELAEIWSCRTATRDIFELEFAGF